MGRNQTNPAAMIPIVTPTEMAAIDAAAPESVEELVDRAGSALAVAARTMLKGSYGRRVTVLAGQGNNGADGRAAAYYLRRNGVRVAVVDAADSPQTLPPCHLTIDAAYGTGLSRDHCPAPPPLSLNTRHDTPNQRAPILAADIPSGVNGLTGELHGNPWHATRTLAFGTLKPGLVLHPGARYCGPISVATLGLDTSQAKAHLLTASTAANWLPGRPTAAHKWHAACWIIAGSQHMTGAAHLAALSSLRGGAGYVRLSTPGTNNFSGGPIEAVRHALPQKGWWQHMANQDLPRFKAILIGPGLGRQPHFNSEIRELLTHAPLPLVIDGDGLNALGSDVFKVLASRPAATILTPHAGEYRALTGSPPRPDSFDAARSLATSTNATVLLKGPCTIVAQPDGTTIAIHNGDARLATAGTGDVLAGLICGLLSAGAPPQQATATAAWLHGQATQALPHAPITASDLLPALAHAWETTAAHRSSQRVPDTPKTVERPHQKSTP
ncbi:MAG: NAD(P)H-hydrate dehydratase [Acidimicrobiia bacterium]|nr:NAD(P)H-hydrate dehydratase [Acidimicrobiia bacterium]MYC58339.1 NAD(P)H-hydrate dehydratase [Acidimicrobiia bacterium]MYI29954.1 NAD(P)H-hydrate dehydratase [Acidimicrobiia bacterium]